MPLKRTSNKTSKKTLFVLVGELVTFHPSVGFNVTSSLAQKVTVYEGTVGLDVTRNKATEVKNEQGVVGLFCQITGQRSASFTTIYCELHSTLLSSMDGNIFFLEYMFSRHTAFLLSSRYPGITWQLADDIFYWVSVQIFRLRVNDDKAVYHWG